MPLVIGTLGMVSKDFEKRLEELEIIETIQMTAFLKLVRIARTVMENGGVTLSTRLQ